MVNGIPQGYHSISVILSVKNSKEAIEFYKKALGAQVHLIMPSPSGGVAHAKLVVGDCMLMLGDENPDVTAYNPITSKETKAVSLLEVFGWKSPETMGGCPLLLYIYTDNVEQLFKNAVDAGAKVILPLQDCFWGEKIGAVKDPFGYSWMFATETKKMTPTEMYDASQNYFKEIMEANTETKK